MGIYAFQHNNSVNMYIRSSIKLYIRIYNHLINYSTVNRLHLQWALKNMKKNLYFTYIRVLYL